MSAPDTDVEKQARRHRFVLRGIALVSILAAVLLVGYLLVLADRGDTPRDADTIEIVPD